MTILDLLPVRRACARGRGRPPAIIIQNQTIGRAYPHPGGRHGMKAAGQKSGNLLGENPRG